MRHTIPRDIGRNRWSRLTATLTAGTISFAATAMAAPAPGGTTLLRESSARIISVDMVTPSIGYVDGYQEGRFVLWRTNDGGRTWTRYAVPGAPRARNSTTTTPTVSFLGPNVGWIAWIVPAKTSNTLTVLRTTTGGRLWHRSVTPIAHAMSMVEQVEFISGQDGWIRAFSGGAMMQGDTDIFRTTNQGASWTLMSAASGYVPNPHPTPQALPAMDEPMPMTFTSTRDGWVAVGNFVVSTASASLYHTTDAGARWVQMALSVPKAYSRESTIGFTPIFAGLHGTVLMQYQGQSNRLIAYNTRNGGSTWTIGSTMPLKRSQYAIQSSFINPRRGWIMDDAMTRFDSTTSSGKTWSPIPVSEVLQSASRHGYRVENLQMTSPSTGWLLLQQVNGITSATKSLLLKTADGGTTWKTTLTADGTLPD